MAELTNDQKEARRIERLRFRQAHTLELIRATCAFEHAALRPPLLLNGGAAGGFLALFGAMAGRVTLNANLVLGAVLLWIIGLVCAAIATAFGYRSQHLFRKARDRGLAAAEADDEGQPEFAVTEKRKETTFNDDADDAREWAKRLWVASMVLFVVGVVVAMCALYNVQSIGPNIAPPPQWPSGSAGG